MIIFRTFGAWVNDSCKRKLAFNNTPADECQLIKWNDICRANRGNKINNNRILHEIWAERRNNDMLVRLQSLCHILCRCVKPNIFIFFILIIYLEYFLTQHLSSGSLNWPLFRERDSPLCSSPNGLILFRRKYAINIGNLVKY